MVLPTAVRRRSEQARRMVAERNGQAPAQSLQPATGEFLNVGSDDATLSPDTRIAPVAPDNPASQSDRIPHVLDDSYIGDQSDSVDAMPSDTDTVSDNTSVSGYVDEHDWKARYTNLRIARDARIADLERESSQLKEANADLNGKLKPTGKDSSAAESFKLDADDRASLGESRARELDAQLSRQEDERKQEVQRTAVAFESDLESQVPNWRQINVDKDFLSWLNQNDDVTGVRRQDMLNGFVDRRDAGSVAAVFRSFAGRSTHTQQRNGQEPNLDVSTSRTGTGMADGETMVETWDQSEISDFFQRKSQLYRSGKLKGELLNKVTAEESRIRTAMAEGRVDMTR